MREIRRRVTWPPRSDRPWVALLLVGLILNELLIPFARYPAVLGADWATYRDGFDRLVHGLPLYDPRLLAGPYDYLSPAFSGMFNMPPWFLPLIVPAAALPALLGAIVWWLTVVITMTLAVVLAVPSRHRLLTIALLVASTPLWMVVAWANAEALVVLGLVVWMIGVRQNRSSLMAVGVFLASIKIAPAVPLAIYMVRTGRTRPLIAATGAAVGVVLGLCLITGSNVLSDFVVAFQNIEQVVATNVAPSVVLQHLVPGVDTVLITRLIAVGLLGLFLIVPISLMDVAWMEFVVSAIPLNVFSFWLLAPVLLGLAAYRYASAVTLVPSVEPRSPGAPGLVTAEPGTG